MNHKKAIAYIRVSTTHQDVERQRIKFKEYCKNNNLQANEEIIDFGISGAKSDRPGYLRLQALTGKDADILENPAHLAPSRPIQTDPLHPIQIDPFCPFEIAPFK